MDYEKEGGKEELKEAIRFLHSSVGNAVTKDKHIVVANGATQVLMAAMFAYAKIYGIQNVYAKPPYWFRFPEMTDINKLKFVNEVTPEIISNTLNIITYPSNPENIIGYGEKYSSHNIHDMCYNWPQYIDVSPMNEDIMIFGLAKCTGHAGSRVGWALIKNPQIADEMCRYIEYDTGGVSVESQIRAATLLDKQAYIYKELSPYGGVTCFSYGKKILDSRWERIKEVGLLEPGHKSGIQILNNSGMFAWGKYLENNAAKKIEEKFDLLVLGGQASSPGETDKFRMNVGSTDAEFDKFINKFKSL